MLEDALACQGSTCARVQLDSSLDLLLVLLLLLHKVGCPCRRTPWLARGPSGLLLLQEILELALGHSILVVVLPVGVNLLVPVGHTSTRPWAPGVLLDGAVLGSGRTAQNPPARVSGDFPSWLGEALSSQGQVERSRATFPFVSGS